MVEKTERTPKCTPEEYFGKIVPVLLKQAAPSKGKGGICVIRLSGDKKGAWTIDMGKRQIHKGTDPKPDFTLEMDHKDFGSMLQAKLDLDKAFKNSKLRVSGKTELLHGLAEILRPA
jgi:putative sterol carrier protein